MPARRALVTAGTAAALLLCAAFIASFVLGLRGGGPVTDPADPAPAAVLRPHTGRVEVLNASGRAGMARHVTQRLRDDGFDVVFFGNAPAAAGDSSVVLDRTGDDDVARAVARALGIAVVRTQRDTTLYLDATVIIGVDWAPARDPPGTARSGWQRALDWIRPGR